MSRKECRCVKTFNVQKSFDIKMSRNVEVKAKIQSADEIVQKVEEICNSKATLIKQDDTFYCVSEGRLKLRKFEDGTSELIFYDRPDGKGPQLCKYSKVNLPKGIDMNPVLAIALGVDGNVRKTRRLYFIDQTRVHVDTVEGLGDFAELEVVLKDEQSVEEGEQIAENIMQNLGILKEDLIAGAYRDLLAKQPI